METPVYESLTGAVWPGVSQLDSVKWVWFRQSLARDPHTNGVVQLSNGPCGVLAALQAYVVQQIYYPGASADITNPSGAAVEVPTSSAASSEDLHLLADAKVEAATAGAIARMLWVVAVSTARDVGEPSTGPVATWADVADDHRSEVMAACLAPQDSFADPFERTKGAESVEALVRREFTTEASLTEAVAASLPYLCSEGAPAAVLLVYSLILTRGVARAAAEMRKDPSAGTLVYQDGCSEQALVNLALTGRASNFVDDARWADWTGRPLVGFLTDAAGFRPGDCFLHPALPVFVLHSGGHYTTAWSADAAAAAVEDTPPLPPREVGAEGPAAADATAPTDGPPVERPSAASPTAPPEHAARPAAPEESAEGLHTSSADPAETARDGGGALREDDPGRTRSGAAASSSAPGPVRSPQPWEWRISPPVFGFWHFNGLHPLHADGHPTRLSRFRLGMYGPTGPPDGEAEAPGGGACESSREAENRARKVKRVLQHRVADGGSKEGGPFEFLVVCEKGGSMEGAGERDLPPYWPSRWYCRDCTLKGDWGGYNAAEAMECKACGKPARECGWAHWLGEGELPRDTLATWKRSHAPAALQVVRVRWPRAEAEWEGPPPALFG